MFNLFQKKSTFTNTSTNATLDNEMSKNLSYQDVQNIYLNFPLGSRIVNLPINLAFCNFKTGLENLDTELINELDIPFLITKAKEFIRNVRIYGVAGLLAITEDDNISEPLLKSTITNSNLRFNVADPLQMNIKIDTNANSFSYRKVKNVSIGGKAVNHNRILILQNGQNQLNLKFNDASFSWAGLSVYSSIYPILNLLNTSLISLERQMLFSSLMILNQDKIDITSNANQKIIEEQSQILKNAKQNSVIILKNGLTLNQFRLENLAPIQSTLDNINNLLAISSDIPSLIFSGEKLSNGFSEGNSELELLNLYLDNIRNDFIIPTMKFLLEFQIYNKIEDLTLKNEMINALDLSFAPISKEDYIEEENKIETTKGA